MSRDWTPEELAAASEAMKAAGHMSFEEFCEELKRQEKLIVELCPECGAENAIAWDVEDAGYKAYCPHCGTPMMLCSMCDREPCDWTEEGGCKHNRKTAPLAARNELQQPRSGGREQTPAQRKSAADGRGNRNWNKNKKTPSQDGEIL